MNQIEESFEREDTPREECWCAGNSLACFDHYEADTTRGEDQ